MTTSKNPSEAGFVKRWLLGWLPFWAWTWFVFESAVLPPRKIPRFLLHFSDKFIHGTLYFVLALFAVHAFENARTGLVRQNSYRFALVYGMLMGALTEISQMYVAGRSCDFRDWMADLTGTLAALILVLVVRQRRGK